MTQNLVEITGGVDTHKDTHTAAAIDSAGRLLGSAQFPADAAGYRRLLEWLQSLGSLVLVGIEGTGSYGAGLAGYLTAQSVQIVEIDRPDRKTRRHQGKSDPIDAAAAARTALAGYRTGTPKQRDGRIEALRMLRIARRSAVAQRSDCMRQIKAVVVTAPEELRAQLQHLSDNQLLSTCCAARPDSSRVAEPVQAAKLTLRSLARRHGALSVEIAALDKNIKPLVTEANPALLALHGVGPDIAGQLLVTAGENTDRLRSEGAFAMLCGVAPLPASSGRTDRHRLNRGGDRQANAALYRAVIVRMGSHPETRAYVQRRTTEGLKKKDIIRCLKRLLAREVYYLIRPQTPALHAA
ncbi:MAG: IS110 family transposase [Candidatus Nanopelagicales bacterium]